ncbi:MAG: hydroxymethylpyrimidine/phosphomethylpyrimidine kinase, partial [Cyanobacteriota bacterium]
TALRVHGCSAISCVTAQNTLGVNRVDGLPPGALSAQIEAVVSDLAVGALKTGMLLNRALIEATAEAIKPLAVPKLIDPVMVSRAGAVLLEPGAIAAYRRCLLPQAELLTPNLHEARLLTGLAIRSAAEVEEAAAALLGLGAGSGTPGGVEAEGAAMGVMGPRAVLIKGGGLAELRGRDYLLSRGGPGRWLEHAPIATPHTHGSGCTLGAAITAGRARGLALEEAVVTAKAFVEGALRRALAIGGGQGPLCHWHGLEPDPNGAPRRAEEAP